MAKFRKKPVVIEAFQMTEARKSDNSEWPAWLNEAWNRDPLDGGALYTHRDGEGGRAMFIRTLEGEHRVTPGDFIIQGVKGELYPCKPDIFAATYEPVED